MNELEDVIIVGAGAAGLMTAILCRQSGVPRVRLLERKQKLGAKILMSGGNRCNVTNRVVTEKEYQSETPRFVRHVLSAFPVEKTLSFFKGLGVELVLEPTGKYFPKTHLAKTVLDALLREVKQRGVFLETEKMIDKITFSDGVFHLSGSDFHAQAKTMVLATGGKSHPGTGSDGLGYRLAQSLGHSLIETTPGLTPFLTDDADWKKLSGLSLPVRLTLRTENGKKVSFQDPLLFTHFGLSGPAILNISRYWVRAKGKKELLCDFLPHLTQEKLDQEWQHLLKSAPRKQLKSTLLSYFPDRFVDLFLKKNGLDPEKRLNQISKKEKQRLFENLFATPLEIKKVYGYEKAEVTAGGVSLDEIDSATLESKKMPGLFFAGEIVDVDGHIGGFNFQWAWSSGFVAASGVAKRLKIKEKKYASQ